MNNKTRLQFIQIDIVDYYPSISLELFNKAIEFARTCVNIDNLTIDIVLNARKSLLFHNNSAWIKQSGSFYITLGAFDGAEVCELVGLFRS